MAPRLTARLNVSSVIRAMPRSPERKYASVEETLRHPAYPGVLWALEPHRSGKLPVAKDRGGPLDIAWELHGDGRIKVVLIMGLAGVKSSWQRQTKHFGHDNGDRYSVLILDNRGIGESDKPVSRYATSDMALDIVEVLNHVGWTEQRQVHLVGISLGGMIAQEVAYAEPQRLASLSLLCTSANLQHETSLWRTVVDRFPMLMPKTEERAIEDTARQIFAEDWLGAPDEGHLPIPGVTPRCAPPPGSNSDKYLLFDTNFQRFQAQELHKRRDRLAFNKPAFLAQLVAAGWHSKSPEQLTEMGDKVGRERIMVMFGTEDKMITPDNGERLVEQLRPEEVHKVQGMGHAPVMEKVVWFNEVLEGRFAAGEKLRAEEEDVVVVERGDGQESS